MTLTKDFATKAAVAFVALAMIFTAYAPAAQAQSAEDLQAMINNLLAQIASLQAQVGGGSTVAAGVCPYTWTRSLNVGASGADVMMLQQFLNADPDTRVAAAGSVGSAGMETEYYGPATGAAVSKLQVKYRSDILSPAGLVNPTTYFGPSTRAKANSLCVAAPVVTVPTTGDDSDDSSDDSDDDTSNSNSASSQSLSGTADLQDFEIDDPSDNTIDEGAEDVEVAEFTVRFENGDAEIDRIEFATLRDSEENTNSVEPWDVFESFSMWVDGEKIAEEEADTENDWLDDDNGTFRFTGLDIFAEEDEDVVITLAATIQNGLETGELGDWTLVAEEIRFFDADGESDDDSVTDDLNNFARAGSAPVLPATDSSQFEIQDEGQDDELFVRTSTQDPDATTFELEDDETSDWTTVFFFDLDTEDSTNDIQVENLDVQITATDGAGNATSTINLIDDIQLLVDGQEMDDVTFTHSTTGVFSFDLDDEDFFIDAGDRVTVEVQVEFEALTTGTGFEGSTIIVKVNSALEGSAAAISAEGAENLTGSSQLSGSAISEEHTLRTEGVILEPNSFSEVEIENSDTTSADDEGNFVIKFDVTAFEADVFVPKTSFRGASTTVGATYTIEDGSGVVVTTGTTTHGLTSTADTEGSNFRVDEGQTETFTLTVVFDPVDGGLYQVQLGNFNFNIANALPNAAQQALDESDYETDQLSI